MPPNEIIDNSVKRIDNSVKPASKPDQLATNEPRVTEGDPELNQPRSAAWLSGITGPGGSLP